MLQPFLDNQQLIVANTAVAQFEKLMEQFGGKQERHHWQALKDKLVIFCCDQVPLAKGNELKVADLSQAQHNHSFDFLQNRAPKCLPWGMIDTLSH